MFTTALSVAFGGALGAVARFYFGVAALRLAGPGFPVGVLGVNILGSFVMGALVVYLGQKSLGHLTPFLLTGVLGGFTTFSAFSLEAYTLFERGEMGQAGLYVGLSVIASIGALVVGVWLMRSILS